MLPCGLLSSGCLASPCGAVACERYEGPGEMEMLPVSDYGGFLLLACHRGTTERGNHVRRGCTSVHLGRCDVRVRRIDTIGPPLAQCRAPVHERHLRVPWRVVLCGDCGRLRRDWMARRPNAPNRVGIHGYRCLGGLDPGLQTITQARQPWPKPCRRWSRRRP